VKLKKPMYLLYTGLGCWKGEYYCIVSQ